jgi:hypothetical protein
MILPAARFDGLQVLDIQQPGPLIDHLLEMPQHLAALILPVSFMVPGAHVAPGQAVVTGSVLGKVMVQQYNFLFFMIWLGV